MSDLQAQIFNIQRFSIQDGPGIRTTVFFKGCPLSCKWCSNPESQRSLPELMFRQQSCQACGSCLLQCDQNAISQVSGITTIERTLCNNCFKCIEVCCSGALSVTGETLTLSEVLDEVLRDSLFYTNSKGGVTLSGGEPLVQIDFVKQLLKRLKELSIDTTIDTCGQVEWPYFNEILPFTDRFLFDLKHLHSKIHKKETGVDNQLILDNLAKLMDTDLASVWIRIPVISGFNESVQHFKEISSFLKGRRVEKVSLLSYHTWGSAKYESLGRQHLWPVTEPGDAVVLEKLKRILEEGGQNVTIGF